jgi:hypothetical protein
MILPPPPLFNLTKPPEPLLEIGQVLEITQQLLDIKSNKCLERKRVEVYNDQNYVYSIYIIIFFIILFIILSIILLRYVILSPLSFITIFNIILII